MSPNGNPLTNEEQSLVLELMDASATVESVIPPDVADDVLLRHLGTYCRAFTFLNRQSAKLKPVIGRMLLMVQQRPSTYRAAGYTSFEDFLAKEVCGKLGMCRSEAYDCKRIAERWPTLSMEQYADIGPSRLLILTRANVTERTPNYQEFLDSAKGMKVADLRAWASSSGRIENGETLPASIMIHTEQHIADEWAAFIETTEVQAHCGSDRPGVILRCLMQECLAEWLQHDQGQSREDHRA